MKTNFQGFKRSLRNLNKRDVQFIKGGEAPAQHDAVRVSKLGRHERIKGKKHPSDHDMEYAWHQ